MAVDLLEQGTTLVGTTQCNRKDFLQVTINKKAIDGTISFLDNKIQCFVWLDNKPVFFIDTMFGATPHITISRKRNDGLIIQISCPEVVKAYTQNMGGVDLADQMRTFYTCTHKSSHRWYLRLFWFLVDVAIAVQRTVASYVTVAPFVTPYNSKHVLRVT